MDRTPVSSTSIASIGYDKRTRTLEVEFRHGAVYQYFDVPEAVYQAFLLADSRGAYLNTKIKGTYRYGQM